MLLLMATCATDNMEGMVLIFERVYFGSLYNYLHEKVNSVGNIDFEIQVAQNIYHQNLILLV